MLCLTQQVVHQTPMLVIITHFIIMIAGQLGLASNCAAWNLGHSMIVSASVAPALACNSWESSGGQKRTRQLRQPHRQVT